MSEELTPKQIKENKKKNIEFTQSQLDDLEKLSFPVDLSKEDKLQYLKQQIDGFTKERYRYEIDVALGRAYIEEGERLESDAHLINGQKKIVEAVGNLKSIALNLEYLCAERDKLTS